VPLFILSSHVPSLAYDLPSLKFGGYFSSWAEQNWWCWTLWFSKDHIHYSFLWIILKFAWKKHIQFGNKCSQQHWKCCGAPSWLSGQANGGCNTCWIRNESFRWYYWRHYWQGISEYMFFCIGYMSIKFKVSCLLSKSSFFILLDIWGSRYKTWWENWQGGMAEPCPEASIFVEKYDSPISPVSTVDELPFSWQFEFTSWISTWVPRDIFEAQHLRS